MKNAVNIIKNLLFPKRCACCGNLIHKNQLICSQCEEKTKTLRNENIYCYNKRELSLYSYFRNYEFESCISPFIFNGIIRRGLHSLKFRGKITAAEFFSKEISDCIIKNLNEELDGIVFVPLSKKRKAIRGYNQAELLAKGISEIINLPVFENALEKIWDNSEQHNSEYYRRFGNIFGVYEADKNICEGKRLLLVDDITTTGATLNECAKMLKLSGAKSVHCATAACVFKNSKTDAVISI